MKTTNKGPYYVDLSKIVLFRDFAVEDGKGHNEWTDDGDETDYDLHMTKDGWLLDPYDLS